MRKLLLLTAMLLVVTAASAQWKVGLTGGSAWNWHTGPRYDVNHCDMKYEMKIGSTFGLLTQYQFNDWFGIRADLDYVSKDYVISYASSNNIHDNMDITCFSYTEMQTRLNRYLLLPVKADFSFGISDRSRLYGNLGFYAGYWMSERFHHSVDICSAETDYYNGKREFDSRADRRFDAGFTAGFGICYSLCRHFEISVEGLCYYGLVSSAKNYSPYVENRRYDVTASARFGVSYKF